MEQVIDNAFWGQWNKNFYRIIWNVEVQRTRAWFSGEGFAFSDAIIQSWSESSESSNRSSFGYHRLTPSARGSVQRKAPIIFPIRESQDPSCTQSKSSYVQYYYYSFTNGTFSHVTVTPSWSASRCFSFHSSIRPLHHHLLDTLFRILDCHALSHQLRSMEIPGTFVVALLRCNTSAVSARCTRYMYVLKDHPPNRGDMYDY